MDRRNFIRKTSAALSLGLISANVPAIAKPENTSKSVVIDNDSENDFVLYLSQSEMDDHIIRSALDYLQFCRGSKVRFKS